MAAEEVKKKEDRKVCLDILNKLQTENSIAINESRPLKKKAAKYISDTSYASQYL